MRRLVGTPSVVVVSLAAASPVGAKEEYWAQICGQSGCKFIKDRFAAAALTTEAEERGVERAALGRRRLQSALRHPTVRANHRADALDLREDHRLHYSVIAALRQ
jgi:hypothetical protein